MNGADAGGRPPGAPGDRAGVRTIDAGTLPARYARGWHCLGLAETFRGGGPHAVQAFGTKLVVFADSSGRLHVLDAFCRHMGGDLTMGTIKGDQVACPFHDWRWGGDGRCAAIPYARRVPPAARTRSWLTLEENKQLFVWNDPQGNPPPEHVTIPRIDGAFSAEWSNWTWDSILVENSNCREVVDNVVDMAHFFYIHFAFPTYFKNVLEGHVAAQYLTTKIAAGCRDRLELHRRRRDHAALGGGLLRAVLHDRLPVARLSRHDDGERADQLPLPGDARLVPAPVGGDREEASRRQRRAGLTRSRPSSPSSSGSASARTWRSGRTRPRSTTRCCAPRTARSTSCGAGTSSSTSTLADVTPDMVARHEYEIDTTRAIQSWEAEVAANLEARAGQQG